MYHTELEPKSKREHGFRRVKRISQTAILKGEYYKIMSKPPDVHMATVGQIINKFNGLYSQPPWMRLIKEN